MSRFVFFNADEARVVVSIDEVEVGRASDVNELVKILAANNIAAIDEAYMSSSIDFASDEGFGSDDAAYEMIEEAFESLELFGA